MTLLINAVVFVAALPLSVWLLSQMLALIDEPDRSHPLIRLAASAIVVLTFLILTDRALWLPMSLAFGLVVALHLGYYYAFRTLFMGVPLYERSPPPPAPVLTEVEGEINFDP